MGKAIIKHFNDNYYFYILSFGYLDTKFVYNYLQRILYEVRLL